MNIILTTLSAGLDSELDSRFGRAAYFLLVNPDTLEWKALPNPALNATGGAGVQAAQLVTDQKCTTVISGDFGPNAYNALKAAGVSMYLFGARRTVQEALQGFKSGQLELLAAPTKPGHR